MENIKKWISQQPDGQDSVWGCHKYTFVDPSYQHVKVREITKGTYEVTDSRNNGKFRCEVSCDIRGTAMKLSSDSYNSNEYFCNCSIELPSSCNVSITSLVLITRDKYKNKGLACYGFIVLKAYMCSYLGRLPMESRWMLNYINAGDIKDQYLFVLKELSKFKDTVPSNVRALLRKNGITDENVEFKYGDDEEDATEFKNDVMEVISMTFSVKIVDRLFGYDIDRIDVDSSGLAQGFTVFTSKKHERYFHIFHEAFPGVYFNRTTDYHYNVCDVNTHFVLYIIRLEEEKFTIWKNGSNNNMLEAMFTPETDEPLVISSLDTKECGEYYNMILVVMRDFID